MPTNKETIFAVDFDGTLCENAYPQIGKPKMRMIKKCIDLKNKGYTLILWTCRQNEDLKLAVKWCKNLGLEFDYANENPQWAIEKFNNDSRKLGATYYIDDKNLSLRQFLRKKF